MLQTMLDRSMGGMKNSQSLLLSAGFGIDSELKY